jgi:choline dehydrogenase-like flavoprotein
VTTTPTPDVDAVVIGAGFGGIYMLHQLRDELGLTVQAFEKGGGVGGTWYFNTYPGAKSDTEGFVATPSTRTCCRSGTGARGTWTSPTSSPTCSTSSSATTSRATSS